MTDSDRAREEGRCGGVCVCVCIGQERDREPHEGLTETRIPQESKPTRDKEKSCVYNPGKSTSAKIPLTCSKRPVRLQWREEHALRGKG